MKKKSNRSWRKRARDRKRAYDLALNSGYYKPYFDGKLRLFLNDKFFIF